jgi:hypothetical protein
MAKPQTIKPKSILARGRNGDFDLKGFEIVGLKTSERFVLTINLNSKSSGIQLLKGKASFQQPPIQLTGKPEALLALFQEITAELEAVIAPSWRLSETCIVATCEGGHLVKVPEKTGEETGEAEGADGF